MKNRILSVSHMFALALLLIGCGSVDSTAISVENSSDNLETFETTTESSTGTEPADRETTEPTSIDDTEIATTESEPEVLSPSVSLVMVGDILLHTPVEESALQADGSYDFHPIFANVKNRIEEADLALVNQEVILGGADLGISGYPCFNAPYEVGDALADTGFDIILHGTNHALDKGKKGLTNCLSFWNKQYPHITVLGINESQEEQDSVYVYEQDNIRIAILNYTYGTNGISLPSDMPYGVDLLEKEKVIADLQKAEELADFTIVCPHWGTEYNLGVSGEQKKWAQIFLENGADLILGTHPHVIEPIEWLSDEETGNEMLVYYSLGNFVNWTSGSGDGTANRMVGGMANVTIGPDENGDISITDYGVTALVCHLQDGTNGVTAYPLSDYTEEQGTENAIVTQDSHFSREYCVNLCNQVWGDFWE